jgi:hypothetical protein
MSGAIFNRNANRPTSSSSYSSGVNSSGTAPRTMLGVPSHNYEKHREDAREWLMQDGRAAVREGLMTPTEFEKYTGER